MAQAQHSLRHQALTRFWMYTGMVGYQGEKMSKSLGNLVSARDVLQYHISDALRLYLHSHHYRTPWEYIDGGPAESRRAGQPAQGSPDSRQSGR
ncbi:MAG: class I tRNA ligase family protein [Thermomicrobiales bacterium]